MDYVVNGYRVKKLASEGGYGIVGFDLAWDGLGEAMAFAASQPTPGTDSY